ncbi:MAG: carboxymuconolactone decarboxylase family protein [Desulfofustis sp.]|nr:carboxymuconolactone decarboxylase family protein [Desulfofustis sp.]MBT8346000.1 carboxymuconolactone decarboxylase family protein [Desulfofustis sp.]MBT8354669.1 carboxymuconolactone decarboxylase family protein [Desulfofustis sp.]NNF47348.1 carboxymuconolactone decarboxylase family protein [Desulfofustis sp.]NNK58622.1 carboxymuconolactone decarboxylase family protein [Desulfofustis sp.]
MSEKKKISKHYHYLKSNFPEVLEAVENLGATVRQAGPLDKKTTELIQLGVAAATGSTGAVHSHAKRALGAGASRQELEHALLVLVSTIGFPKVAAALAWIQEVVD